MTAVEALRRAKELLSDPAKWTKGAMARGTWGVSCGVAFVGADCFCANGALLSLYRGTGECTASGASLWLSAAAQKLGFENVTAMNDAAGTTHADIMALYDRAILLAEAAQ